MRGRLALLLLAATAAGDDGAAAPPARWSHARGPASGSAVSLARPPESFGGIRWTYKAKEVLAPPVVWDGTAFLLDGTAKRADLVALDVETGEARARTPVASPGQPVAFGRSVFLVEERARLQQFRLDGRSFSREWRYEAAGLSDPRIVDGEIYAIAGGSLLSLRAGSGKPRWKVDGGFVGEPAVRDGHVYALRREGGRLSLYVHARTDGSEVAAVVLSENAADAPGGRVVVGGEVAAALLPPEGDRKWLILARKLEEGRLELEVSRTEKLLTEPMAGPKMLLAVTGEPRAWSILRATGKQVGAPLVDERSRPDLFEAVAPAVWLGESGQCFGCWCANIEGNEIFWHASERPEGAPLRKGLRFHAVPARHELLLLVPADGASVLALAPEEIG